jgi:molecular chaperone GrpE
MTGPNDSDDPNRNPETPAEPARPEPAGDTASDAPATGEPLAEGELIAELEKERIRLEADVAETKDRLLRAHAEMENIRKRSEREKADAAKYGITKFAMDMLSVADNLQRAMDAVPNPAEVADDLKAMYEGVALTAQELGNALQKGGVTKIAAKGEIFDPHLHQAMMEQPDPSVASGTILQVFQDGYTIGDRVLRPAMVVVARGGMKPPKAEAPKADLEPISPDDDPAAQSGPGDQDTPDGTREAS